MFASTYKQGTVWRGTFSAVRTIESFLDPVVAIALLFAVAGAYGERFGPPYVILALIAFSLTFPGDFHLRERPRRMVRNTLSSWICMAAILLAFGYASGYVHYFPQRMIAVWLATLPAASLLMHACARRLLPRIMALDGNQRRAVVVGCNETGLRLAREFVQNPFNGVSFAGFIDDRGRDRLEGVGDAPILGRLDQLSAFVNANAIDHIYLALPMASQPRILKLLDDLKDTTVSIFFAPDIFLTDLIQGRVDHVGGMPVVAVCETPFTGFDGFVKRSSDIVLSILILTLISPVMLAIAAAVKLSSPGPVIFRQRRYGLDGKEIVVYKFRSMTTCDDGKEVKQATRNDLRITRVGAMLRRTSLDELPQFINVLQGRMSIVGPRPHAVAHNETYRKLITGYMVRHKVKPGITGWAQVCGYRGETETIGKMEKRIEHDLEYLRTWSLSLDLWIIIKTVLMVLRDRNAY
ncbi:undecaprenyl-phosphate glucose phosphotransferase [Aromatoleum diolicum]|uniref:Undecaprenyl-phosphate glucose phosphotransferase n=1 Tax=Aromatoleum diolicum TaxID=75796 RepID=A0ABX1QGV7_9RHOO|nr:undecaprenyl-phosphate glucose phosphotransferase [Aromatoleum diolicum]NMG76651.1 undecaprenyl-phosphate glucose phosphotransferase [Aromatoleum diolicum]